MPLSPFKPEVEIVDKSIGSVRYLEHGWPTSLCRWHAHEEYELHLMMATQGRTFIGDFIGQFSPGSFYLVGPRVPHNWVTYAEHTERTAVRDRLIQFQHNAWMQASHSYPELKEVNGLLEESRKGIEFVDYEPQRASKQLTAIRDSSGMQKLLVFFELMLELNAWPHRQTLSVSQLTNSGFEQHAEISDIVEHVTLNYTSKISLKTVAELAGMNPSAFSRHFKKITGNRFSDFVVLIRVGHACTKLRETDELVGAIGAAVGFNNLANFNRHFLRHKGMTPRDYRRNARESLSARQLDNSSPSEGLNIA